MPRHPTGIRPWKKGWQAYVRVAGRLRSKTFPASTTIQTMQAWRETQRTRHATGAPLAGTLAADIVTYLSRVSAMPSYKQRAAHLALWADALGLERARHDITTADIDRVLQDWLRTSPPRAPGRAGGRPSPSGGLSPGTVRKRRTALLSLWHKLDGRQAPNPVRASYAPREPKAESRGLDYDTIARILAALPESGAKRRLTVIAYTGLPPSLLMTVADADVHLEAATVRVRPRRKGAGVEARTLPLLPQGVEAFRAFGAAQTWGRFSVNAVNRAFRTAAAKVGVTGVTLYDLRHSFLAMLYLVTHDLATVARFGLHASFAMTERYARSAMQSIDRRAAELAGAKLAARCPD